MHMFYSSCDHHLQVSIYKLQSTLQILNDAWENDDQTQYGNAISHCTKNEVFDQGFLQ